MIHINEDPEPAKNTVLTNADPALTDDDDLFGYRTRTHADLGVMINIKGRLS
jgi:hypothetical protein